ncbi:sigma-54-dependent transcriptional regulator [Candidatus Pelagibacter communis]|uniref:sigma-54-dependent transcriptional regulator n=1 Tax=Pelagibacter ubique TaxID=198252 RepID=UPI00094C613F|nr:sigma-54 dependent transcriptional regulator [Candidatus Pelagibacter ubique]
MTAEIFIVDDNADIRNILNDLITDAGYSTRVAANFNQALREIDKKIPDVAILDVKLDKGDNDGIQLLSHIKSKNKDVPVIMISGHANIEMAIDSLKHGAFEFVEKPFDQTRLLNFVSRAVENLNLKNQNKEYETKLFSSYDLIGNSKNISTIRDQIEKISITDSRILINGPSGSGKELIARKIHKKSKRKEKPFIILNGALLDNNKYEQELFGEEKSDGSISYGALEKANKGTLLIDQISEIPLDIQSKILRVLIDQKFKRINGTNDVRVDVRLICSSNKDLKNEIELGDFREDLYHRISVFEIHIEPLNNRISDIPLLINYFSKKISENYNIKTLKIDENDSYILNHNWKGNVRELRNLIERIAILQPENKEKISNIIKESLKSDNFHEKITENSLSVPLKEAREKFEKEYLTVQLKKFNGNISKTANFVGMERSALHRKLKGLGIKEFN